jgi:hypothetical protein
MDDMTHHRNDHEHARLIAVAHQTMSALQLGKINTGNLCAS